MQKKGVVTSRRFTDFQCFRAWLRLTGSCDVRKTCDAEIRQGVGVEVELGVNFDGQGLTSRETRCKDLVTRVSVCVCVCVCM